uniref:Uncharacterized protein n=1 Tax=Siphoviridae sp. ctsoB6 TaxID=2826487 RepID=A0A8S5QPQ5_9CAUD|nr:MAG TPA: hypothetical protein [Siphoviridae sp. ctsoB6]
MNGRPLIFQGTIFLFKKLFIIFRPNGHLTCYEVPFVKSKFTKITTNFSFH